MTAKYMIVLFRTYGIHCVVFGLLGSVIAVTAFRRGERWAWWTLLVGNTLALRVGHELRLDRQRHRAVRADGIPWPRSRLGSARRDSSIPYSATAGSSGWLTRHARQRRTQA
jgi:hypothetical protein